MASLVATRTRPLLDEEVSQLDKEDQLKQLRSIRLKAPVHNPLTHCRSHAANASLESCSAAVTPPDETTIVNKETSIKTQSLEGNSAQAEPQVSANLPVLGPTAREEVNRQLPKLSVNSPKAEQVCPVSRDVVKDSNDSVRVDSGIGSPDEVSGSERLYILKEEQWTAAPLNGIPVTSSPLIAAASDASSSRTTSDVISDNRVIVTVPILSSDIYRFDKGLYIGKMRELPPPSAAYSEWEDKIKPRLVNDLCSVVKALPRSLKPEETMVEPDLCMSGEASSKSTLVQMEPTIWIRCGSRKCKKAVSRAVSDLGYMRNLSMFRTQIRVRAPKPAAFAEPRQQTALDNRALAEVSENPKLKLEIQKVASMSSACGLKLKILRSGASTERICTIGGLIRVDDQIYGLTTGHALTNLAKPMGQSTERHDMSSAQDISDTDSDYSGTVGDNYSDSETESSEILSHTSQSSTCSSSQIAKLQWERIEPLGLTAFAGQGNLIGALDTLRSAPPNSDIALVCFKSSASLRNIYKIPGVAYTTSIEGRIHDIDLVEGPVWILAGHNEVREGYLLRGKSMFIQRGALFETRKVQLDGPLAQGTSGSWVVRDGRLCGVVVAVYDKEPYIHMLTADRVFADVSNFTFRELVQVATKDDLARLGKPREIPEIRKTHSALEEYWARTEPPPSLEYRNLVDPRYMDLQHDIEHQRGLSGLAAADKPPPSGWHFTVPWEMWPGKKRSVRSNMDDAIIAKRARTEKDKIYARRWALRRVHRLRRLISNLYNHIRLKSSVTLGLNTLERLPIFLSFLVALYYIIRLAVPGRSDVHLELLFSVLAIISFLLSFVIIPLIYWRLRVRAQRPPGVVTCFRCSNTFALYQGESSRYFPEISSWDDDHRYEMY